MTERGGGSCVQGGLVSEWRLGVGVYMCRVMVTHVYLRCFYCFLSLQPNSKIQTAQAISCSKDFLVVSTVGS